MVGKKILYVLNQKISFIFKFGILLGKNTNRFYSLYQIIKYLKTQLILLNSIFVLHQNSIVRFKKLLIKQINLNHPNRHMYEPNMYTFVPLKQTSGWLSKLRKMSRSCQSNLCDNNRIQRAVEQQRSKIALY